MTPGHARIPSKPAARHTCVAARDRDRTTRKQRAMTFAVSALDATEILDSRAVSP